MHNSISLDFENVSDQYTGIRLYTDAGRPRSYFRDVTWYWCIATSRPFIFRPQRLLSPPHCESTTSGDGRCISPFSASKLQRPRPHFPNDLFLISTPRPHSIIVIQKRLLAIHHRFHLLHLYIHHTSHTHHFNFSLSFTDHYRNQKETLTYIPCQSGENTLKSIPFFQPTLLNSSFPTKMSNVSYEDLPEPTRFPLSREQMEDA